MLRFLQRCGRSLGTAELVYRRRPKRRSRPAAEEDELTNLLPNWLRATTGAYLVGGCVRDLLLGRTPTDYDIAFQGDTPAYARLLASAAGGRVVEIGKPAFRIWRVVIGAHIIDVAPLAGGRLDEDLRRRDFTINAMAIDTATGQVIDITGGRADLSAGSIRMVSAAAFRADPIRLLRAFRFASRLGFAVDPQTLATISRDAGLIAQSAGERIRDELFKLLAATPAHPHVSAMQAAGLLQAIFPDVEPTAVEPALQSMRTLETILEGFPGLPPGLAARLSAEFQERRRVVLKCAALLRSIAPSRQGAAVDRLRLSKRDSSRMECLLRPQSLPQEPSPAAGMLTADALRFFQAAGDFAPDLLILEMAVGTVDAALPPAPPRAALAGILRMLRDYFYRYRPRALSPPALTGSDLLREFGLRPSPLFGEILDRVEAERLSRESFTRAEALELVRAHLAGRL
jgi:tRNA nucleotidyltransferase/poly(A) polymerase